jgi:hypothetical protein
LLSAEMILTHISGGGGEPAHASFLPLALRHRHRSKVGTVLVRHYLQEICCNLLSNFVSRESVRYCLRRSNNFDWR